MATTHYLISRQTVGSGGASSITFSNIPQTYTDLKLVFSGRGASNFNPRNLYLNFNSDTGNNYPFRFLYGNGSSATSSNSTSEGFTNTAWIGYIPGNTATASTFGNVEIYIPNYSGSNYKSISADSTTENNATTAYASLHAAIWNSTNAITSLSLTCSNSENFAQYSTVSLYGVSSSGDSTKVPYASGGDVIATDGTYWYHAFKYSGTLTPLKSISSVNILTVGGGGGGGANRGGGGGAGGVVYTTSQSLTSNTSYTVTVGGGGAGGVSGNQGTSGTNSSLTGGALSLTASVGGGGGGTIRVNNSPNDQAYNGKNGGSGGGAGGNAFTGSGTVGQGTAGQGNNGGQSTSGNGYNWAAGGGGGAGGVGGDASGLNPGNGGAGVNTYSSLLTPVSMGVSGYIAGGGGGGNFHEYGGSNSTGGSGGGGAGKENTAGVDATASTGSGGGGGGGNNSGNFSGGAGASGFVIVRYPV